MKKVQILFALALLVFCLQGLSQTNKTKQGKNDKRITQETPPIAKQNENPTRLQNETQKNSPYEVRIVNPSTKDGWDKTAVGINITLAFIGLAGIVIGVFTLVKIERQTSATEKTVKVMIDSERPLDHCPYGTIQNSVFVGQRECTVYVVGKKCREVAR